MGMNDLSRMTFGKYKGTVLSKVPVDYLHWVWHNIDPTSENVKELRDYITKSMKALKQENPDLIW